MYRPTTVLPSIFLLIVLAETRLFFCQRGTFVNNSTCQPCPAGSFMSADNHESTSCSLCTQPIAPNHEMITHACSAYADTVVGCRRGYFKQAHNKWEAECSQCTNCSKIGMIEVQGCSELRDTVCCPGLGMEVHFSTDGVTRCSNKSSAFVCQRGEYLHRSDDQTATCKPCSDGYSYMSQDNHVNVDCAPCSRPVVYDHEITITNCTPTTDAVIGCKKNYFRIERDFHFFKDSDCLRCGECRDGMHQVAPCSADSDAICCPKPGLRVQYSPDGRYRCEEQ